MQPLRAVLLGQPGGARARVRGRDVYRCPEGLGIDYPSYTTTASWSPRPTRTARGDERPQDHYECFQEILETYVDEW